MLPVALQRVPILVEQLLDDLAHLVGLFSGEELAERYDQGRLIHDLATSVDDLGQPLDGAVAGLLARLLDDLLAFLASLLRCEGEQLLGVDAHVPELEIVRSRSLAHRRAVPGGSRHRHLALRVAVHPVLTGGEHEAGREAFQVPFPGTREGFVEVVDIEEECAVGCAEQTEIGEMGVAAELGVDP